MCPSVSQATPSLLTQSPPPPVSRCLPPYAISPLSPFPRTRGIIITHLRRKAAQDCHSGGFSTFPMGIFHICLLYHLFPLGSLGKSTDISPFLNHFLVLFHGIQLHKINCYHSPWRNLAALRDTLQVGNRIVPGKRCAGNTDVDPCIGRHGVSL